jgi:uncharacterized protein YjbI with pentapeptide repeats
VLNRLFHSVNNREVLRFLYESKLIGTTDADPIVSLEGAELPKLFMPMANLRGANLKRINMVDAELIGVHLQGANLQEAYSGGAYLGGAKLRDAQLQHTRLPMADLNGADLAGTDLRGAEISGTNLAGVDLRTVTGLTQAQLKVALGDHTTQAPNYLERPEAWSMSIEDRRLRLSQTP